MKFIVYIALKKFTYYNEVYCSVSSLKHLHKEGLPGSVVIYTDNPKYFQSLCLDPEISTIHVTGDKINSLLGKEKYVYRLKLALINDFINEYKSDFYFVDSDTFFLTGFNFLNNGINSDTIVLHNREYSIGSNLNPGLTLFFKSNDYPGLIDSKNKDDYRVYNSGVIGMNKSQFFLLEEALYWLDELVGELPEQRCLEQIILSFLAQRNGIKIETVENQVMHYWFFKEFTDYLISYFKLGYLQPNYKHQEDNDFQKIDQVPYVDLPNKMFNLLRQYRNAEYLNYHFQVFDEDALSKKLLRDEYF